MLYKEVKNRINKLNKRLLHARKVAGVNSNTYQAIANAMMRVDQEVTKHSIADNGKPIKATYIDKNGNIQISRSTTLASQKYVDKLLDIVENVGTVYGEYEVITKELKRQGMYATPDKVIEFVDEVNKRSDFYDDVWSAMYSMQGYDAEVRAFMDKITGVSGDPAMNTAEAIRLYNERFERANHNLKPIRQIEDAQLYALRDEYVQKSYSDAYDAYNEGDMGTFRSKMREMLGWMNSQQTKTPPVGMPVNAIIPAQVSDEYLDDYIDALFTMMESED